MTEINLHDFSDESLSQVPYGLYDLAMNQGWVNIGINSETADLAIESIQRWWNEMGQPLYPNVQKLLITADCGSSNSKRGRLWQFRLQELADKLSLNIQVCHFPPATSKWHKIEHRLFCHVIQNWRGKPWVSQGIIVKLITAPAPLQTKDLVNGEMLRTIAPKDAPFHEQWNYQIQPRTNP
jgi:hypothetical protein